jgi:hypothetical protein
MPHFRNWTQEWESTRPVLPYLVDKHRHFDVELFTYPESHQRVARTLPFYEDCLDFIGRHPGRVGADSVCRAVKPSPSARGLVIGFGVSADEGWPENTTTFDHAAALTRENPHLLGCRTPFDDRTFDYVVNVDIWRMLTPIDLSALIVECLRISMQTFLVLSRAVRRDASDKIGMVDDVDYFLALARKRCIVDVIHDDHDMIIIRLVQDGAHSAHGSTLPV